MLDDVGGGDIVIGGAAEAIPELLCGCSPVCIKEVATDAILEANFDVFSKQFKSQQNMCTSCGNNLLGPAVTSIACQKCLHVQYQSSMQAI